MQARTKRRSPRTSGRWSWSRRIRSWSTTSVGLSFGQAASRRPGRPWSEPSRWIQAMSWRRRIYAFACGRSPGEKLAKLGTHKRPAVVRVRSVKKAEAIVALCREHGWQVIAGVEEDKPEDTSDVEWLLGRVSDVPKVAGKPQAPPRIGGNDYCPCRNGKKLQKRSEERRV